MAMRPGLARFSLLALVSLLVVRAAIAEDAKPGAELGLPALATTNRSRADETVIRLGRALFSDARLSADGRISCAKCHDPRRAFTDGRQHALGHDEQPGTRNTPSLLNVAFATSLFWDGRASSLESQALLPLLNPLEHGLRSQREISAVIRTDPAYVRDFSVAFHLKAREIDSGLVAQALSAYERTLLAGGSPFDRYLYGHDLKAMSAEAVRGLELFRGRAQCASCHLIGAASALLTDGEYHMTPIGLPSRVTENLPVLTSRVVTAARAADRSVLERLIASDPDVAALGRFVVTLNAADIGNFKTPSLRDVDVTAPYMHDGSVATLEEAVDQELYGRNSALRYPIQLTVSERADLVAFLRSLTSPNARLK